MFLNQKKKVPTPKYNLRSAHIIINEQQLYRTHLNKIRKGNSIHNITIYFMLSNYLYCYTGTI